MAEETAIAPNRPSITDRLRSAFDGWFNPGTPIPPMAPPGTEPRQFDFQQSRNLTWMPRAGEKISFQSLRMFADNCYLMRAIIEKMKDRVCTKSWHFRLKPQPGEYEAQTKDRSNKDPRITKLTEFYTSPDSVRSWKKWLRMLLEDRIVLDAAALEIQRTKDNRIYNLLPIDGATISVLVDATGRTPRAPLPAYRQIIKGLPAIDFADGVPTGDQGQLAYMVANPRTHTMWGYSPVEQTVQLMLLFIYKTVFHLEFYSDSDLPIAQIPYPAEMNVDQGVRLIREIEARLKGNLEERSRMLPVPAGSKIEVIKHEEFSSKFEEWAARVFCFVVGETPTGFVQQNNRATAQQQDDSREESGELPILMWVKDEIDSHVQRPDIFNAPDIEFMWDEVADTDPLKQAQVDQINVTIHKMTPNELRQRDGLSPLDGGDEFPAAPAMGENDDNSESDGGGGDQEGDPKSPKSRAKALKAAGSAQKKTLKIDPGAFTVTRRNATDRIDATLKAFLFAERHAVTAAIAPHLPTAQKASGTDSDQDPDLIVSYIAWSDWDQLATQIQPDLSDIGKDAVAQVFATLNLDSDSEFFSLADTFALEYAQSRAAELVGKKWVNGVLVDNPNAKWAITETTREDLRDLVARAFAEKWSPAELAQQIDASYSFSAGRAEMIAHQESAMALTAATVNAGEKAGATTKSIQMSNLHDIDDECDDAESEGEIPLDSFFPNGELHTPLHINCRCVELLHVAKDEADDQDDDPDQE